MKAHAAIPDGDDFGRVGDKVGQVVEQHVADSAADDDANDGPEGEIPDGTWDERRAIVPPQPVARQEGCPIRGTQQDAAEIGERVPSDDERTDFEGDRVNVGKGHAALHEVRARTSLASGGLWSRRCPEPKYRGR